MQKLRTVRGVHDLLPNELHKHHIVLNAGLEISDKYNYSQIETPIFEFSEVDLPFHGYQCGWAIPQYLRHDYENFKSVLAHFCDYL